MLDRASRFSFVICGQVVVIDGGGSAV